MSWRRRQQDLHRYQRGDSSYNRSQRLVEPGITLPNGFNYTGKRPYPLTRPLDNEDILKILGIVPDAIKEVSEDHPGIEKAIVPRIPPQKPPYLGIVGYNEMDQMKPRTRLTKPQLLNKLYEKTETSKDAIEAEVTGVGYFGRSGPPQLGITFDPDTTELLENERAEAFEILRPANPLEGRHYPRIPIATVHLEREPEAKKDFKLQAQELAQSIGTITLYPVIADYKD